MGKVDLSTTFVKERDFMWYNSIYLKYLTNYRNTIGVIGNPLTGFLSRVHFPVDVSFGERPRTCMNVSFDGLNLTCVRFLCSCYSSFASPSVATKRIINNATGHVFTSKYK